ncbi:hypothetical protein ACFVZ2_08670, partial [Streptomyces lasiicapitis]
PRGGPARSSPPARRPSLVLLPPLAHHHHPPRPARGGGQGPPAPGPHYCIGAALAKLETEIVLNQLLIKHEGLSLAVDRKDLVYAPVPGEGMHLTGLPVRF